MLDGERGKAGREKSSWRERGKAGEREVKLEGEIDKAGERGKAGEREIKLGRER